MTTSATVQKGFGGRGCIGLALGVMVAFGVLALSVPAQAQCLSEGFWAARAYDAGSGPGGFAKGDFNEDGHVDLAVANWESVNVSVLLGTGTGSLGAPANFAVGPRYPRGVATADFDGDGHLDLAVLHSEPDAISVLRGTGTGNFGAAMELALGGTTDGIVAGDFNGDGLADLVVLGRGSQGLSVFLSTGSGGFGPRTDVNLGWSPGFMVAGDFNGDGRLDLALANNPAKAVSILLGTGTGSFGARTDFSVGESAGQVATGDLNGDGRLDLVVVSTTGGYGSISVLLGTGTGTFGAYTQFPEGGARDPVGGTGGFIVALGDFNGDTHPDLVAVRNYPDHLYVFLGTGTGSFGAKTEYAAGAGQGATVTADFNEDGKSDIAMVTFEAEAVSVLLASEAGGFRSLTNVGVGVLPGELVIADFDEDGQRDLAVVNQGSSSVSVLLNAGAGTFEDWTEFGAGSAPSGIAAADFDGDGHLDLAVTNVTKDTVSVLLGTGTGSFGAKTAFTVGHPGDEPRHIAVADFNRDGHPDLVVSNSDSASVLMGTGDGSFAAYVEYAAGAAPRQFGVGDFNGDGYLDLAATNLPTATVSVLLNTGTGAFAAPVAYPVGGPAGSVAVGDFNADGRLDLVVSDFIAGSGSLLLGRGNGTFAARTQFAIGKDAGSLIAEDVNGDGHLDLVAKSDLFNRVFVLLGTGTGSFGASQIYGAGMIVAGLAAGDLDGNGLPELVVSGMETNNVSILRNVYDCPRTLTVSKGGAGSGTVTSSPVGIDCGSACVATYSQGEVVTLTAEATAGFVFAGWSGGGCSGTGTCVVTMNTAAWVTATFGLPPAVVQFGAATYAVGEATATATITVTRTGSTASAVTVGYATSNGTAAAGSDYTAKTGTLTFAAGVTSKTFGVAILNDTLTESSETVNLTLSSPGAGAVLGTPATAVLTITDDDVPPALSIDDVSVAEGNSGTTTATFTVLLSPAPLQTVTVSYATANGSATAGSDYTALSGTLTFPAGRTFRRIMVAVTGDTVLEGDETYTVTLSSPVGATLARAQGTGTIQNDDAPPGVVATEEVVWTATTGVTASGNDLTKTAADGWGNAGAVSTRAIQSGDGYVELVASETTSGRMIGLSKGNTDAGTADIDFGVRLSADGSLMIYEAGASRCTTGTYATGDIIRISVTAGVVRYLRNGVVLCTSSQAPTYPLLVDTSLRHPGATIKDVVISGVLVGSPAGPSPSPTPTPSATPTPSPTPTPGPVTTEEVVWTAASGVMVSGNDLTKTTSQAWGNSGAISTRSIVSGDGYVELIASETTTGRMVGLSNGDTSTSYDDIDFAVYAYSSASLRVYERGVARGTFGTYATGDRIRVSVSAGVVTYSKNGTVFYTSTQAPTYPLLVDAALYSTGATIKDVVISGSLTSSTP